ncbi:hypothetical protein BD749_1779 [Pontibacter ramchanderi]|uniref:Uncharacterized protein n=1 Tax=Pontibacter ramchanderi TaxID=1179743 RepID=A0A2N3UBA9_9BACT|nr:hypothetical protein BD749_1779 [Pontibacter ramchanderi]
MCIFVHSDTKWRKHIQSYQAFAVGLRVARSFGGSGACGGGLWCCLQYLPHIRICHCIARRGGAYPYAGETAPFSGCNPALRPFLRTSESRNNPKAFYIPCSQRRGHSTLRGESFRQRLLHQVFLPLHSTSGPLAGSPIVRAQHTRLLIEEETVQPSGHSLCR